MVIRRVGPLSCAKIMGTLNAIMGVVIGAIFSFISLIGGFASNSYGGAGVSALIGMGSVIFFPLLYGVIGFVTALIGAALYNILAGAVGGIELDVQ